MPSSEKLSLTHCHSESSFRTGALFYKSYLLLDELGRGGFGFVYRCMHRSTCKLFAVKFNIDPDDMSALRQEYYTVSEICCRTGHPNIVNVVGCITDDRIVYTIFEIAVGGDLATDLQAKGFYTEPVAANIMMQVFQGVDYIHSQGYLHRDIKPSNLLILKNTSQLQIKITDFGLAVRRKKAFTTSSTYGTPYYVPHEHGFAGTDSYLSPEVYNKQEYDIECDVWSCGVVLYELLSGYIPFDEPEVLEKPCPEVEFPMPEWRSLELAIDLVQKIFDRRENQKRLTAKEVLSHAFFHRSPQLQPDMSNAILHYNVLKQLKSEFAQLQRQG